MSAIRRRDLERIRRLSREALPALWDCPIGFCEDLALECARHVGTEGAARFSEEFCAAATLPVLLAAWSLGGRDAICTLITECGEPKVRSCR